MTNARSSFNEAKKMKYKQKDFSKEETPKEQPSDANIMNKTLIFPEGPLESKGDVEIL